MKFSFMFKIIRYLIVVLSLFFAGYILFFTLGKPALDNWDEAWYGEVAKQVIKSGNYIKLMWNGNIFLDKPPLYIWIIVFLSKILGGLSEFTIRLASALAGLATVLLVLSYSSKRFGLVAGLIGFGSLILNDVYVWRVRSGNLDSLATMFILLVFLLLVTKLRHKYLYLGFMLASIFLTKAALVTYPLLIVLIGLLIDAGSSWRNKLHNLAVVGVCFIFPIALWLWLGYRQVGIEFVNYFVFKSDQNVGHLALSRFNTSYFSYIYYALQRRLTYLLMIGIGFSIMTFKKYENKILLLFAIPLVIVLSFSPRTNNWYLLPVFPFLSILIAGGTNYIFKITKNNILIKTGLVLVCSYIFYRAYTVNILPIMDTYSSNNQRQSGQLLSVISNPDDIVVRLDQTYPTTIYYSNRKVIVYKNDLVSSGIFIGKSDLEDLMRLGKVRWFNGTPNEVEEFARSITYPHEIIKVNNTESILKIVSKTQI